MSKKGWREIHYYKKQSKSLIKQKKREDVFHPCKTLIFLSSSRRLLSVAFVSSQNSWGFVDDWSSFMLDCCCWFDVVAGLFLSSIHVGVNSSVGRSDSSLKMEARKWAQGHQHPTDSLRTHLKYVLRDCRRSRGWPSSDNLSPSDQLLCNCNNWSRPCLLCSRDFCVQHRYNDNIAPRSHYNHVRDGQYGYICSTFDLQNVNGRRYRSISNAKLLHRPVRESINVFMKYHNPTSLRLRENFIFTHSRTNDYITASGWAGFTLLTESSSTFAGIMTGSVA